MKALKLIGLTLIFFTQNLIAQNYQDAIFQLQIPEEFEIQPKTKASRVQFNYGNSTSEAIIQIEQISTFKAASIQRKGTAGVSKILQKNLKSGLALVHTDGSQETGGTYWHYRSPKAQIDYVVHIVSEVDGYGVLGLAAFSTLKFSELKGINLLEKILVSIRFDKMKSTSGSTSNSAANTNLSSLLGKWKIADKMVDLSSGPFGVLMAGAASKWNLNSNVGGLNTWGSKMIYEFKANGEYEVYYKASATYMPFQSFMEVVEKGNYSIEGELLQIVPLRYSGEGYFGHASQRKKMNIGNLPKRTYRWLRDDKRLVLYGYCGEFQIEPYCEKNKRKQAIVAAFTNVSQ